jgi:hypothetical protein
MAEPLFEFESEEDAIKALQAEGRRLKYIAVKLWRLYLSEYKPTMYVRSRDSQKAIKLGKVKRLDGDSFGIELTFEDDLAYHDSIFNSSKKTHPQGHSFMLISEGWTSKKLEERIFQYLEIKEIRQFNNIKFRHDYLMNKIKECQDKTVANMYDFDDYNSLIDTYEYLKKATKNPEELFNYVK